MDSIYLDPGVKPQDDTTSLKLRGAGITVLCFLFLGIVDSGGGTANPAGGKRVSGIGV